MIPAPTLGPDLPPAYTTTGKCKLKDARRRSVYPRRVSVPRQGLEAAVRRGVRIAPEDDAAPEAARLLGASEALLATISTAYDPAAQCVHDRTMAAALAALADARFAAVSARGASAGLAAAVAEALALAARPLAAPPGGHDLSANDTGS